MGRNAFMVVADRWTIVVLMVDNNGERVDYLDRIRAALLADGFDAWTESPSFGYWRGRGEEGTTITLYLPAPEGDETARASVLRRLTAIAQSSQPDQSSVFISCDPAATLHAGQVG
jgi:hypothetical protein